jgi:hypothetical protein
MPHLKCEACRTRVYRASDLGSTVESCPGCGVPMQPVGDLVEIVGFRSVRPQRRPADDGTGYQAIADSVAAILEQRRAFERRSRRATDRWAP